jgi:cytochrome c-type biogenesis protein CcmF
MILFVLLYAFRAHAVLPADTNKAWGVSKESALIVTQFLLLTLAAIVVIGTLFPVVSEAITGQRTSVQAPYFNAFAPWIGLGMIVMIAVGNVMRYQTSKIPGGKKMMMWSLLLAIPLTVFLVVSGDVMSTPKPFALGAQLVGLYLWSLAAAMITWDLVLRLRDLNWNYGLMWSRNRAFLGAWIAHLGVLIAIIGFLGNYRGISTEATLAKGASKDFYGYDISFDGIVTTKKDNVILFQAPLRVSKNGREISTVYPAKSKYPTSAELLNEIGVMGTTWHDLYIVIADFERQTGSSVTLQIHVNPAVRFVWLSAFFLAFGGLVAMSDRMRGQKSRDVVAGIWEIST